MELIETNIQEVKLLKPRCFYDKRGFFFESYNQRTLAEICLDDIWLQDNHSFSAHQGTIRGMHYQTAPAAQAKLVRVTRGSIYDVAVDVRPESLTFGQFVGAELNSENKFQLYVPKGFAHGFCTLEDNTEVLYKSSAFYSPDNESGIRWDDPDVGINWPVPRNQITIVERDAEFPLLREQTRF